MSIAVSFVKYKYEDSAYVPFLDTNRVTDTLSHVNYLKFYQTNNVSGTDYTYPYLEADGSEQFSDFICLKVRLDNVTGGGIKAGSLNVWRDGDVCDIFYDEGPNLHYSDMDFPGTFYIIPEGNESVAPEFQSGLLILDGTYTSRVPLNTNDLIPDRHRTCWSPLFLVQFKSTEGSYAPYIIQNINLMFEYETLDPGEFTVPG